MITGPELEAMLAARPRVVSSLALDGVLVRAPERGEDDDAWLCPALGLGVVTRGLGAIGNQGRPAAKLAVWSLVGELALGSDPSSEARLRHGLARAEAAVQRLSGNWPAGLLRPCGSLAAVLIEGSVAMIAHVGSCRVARVQGGRLVPLTRDHVLGAELPEVPPHYAGVLTRVLGAGSEPELQRIAVQPGDVLLLSSAPWPAERASLAPGVDAHAAARALARDVDATVIVAQVAARATHRPDRGSAHPPGLAWLFAPGQPLAEPPERYAPGTIGHGPDARWFTEVFDGVLR